MSKGQWAKMPCTWQANADFHECFDGYSAGETIAAMKLYICICLRALNSTDDPRAGTCDKTLRELSALTGLSKPQVLRGTEVLKDLRLITVRVGRPNRYRLLRYNRCPNWTKLPSAYLFAGSQGKEIRRLRGIPNRGTVAAAALRLYLYLASIRDRKNKARVSYDRICEVLWVSRNTVSSAISLLVGNQLISVRGPGDSQEDMTVENSNQYWLLGPTS